MKEQIIQIPDTLEIKEIKDGKIILVEKKKKLTYKNVFKPFDKVLVKDCEEDNWKCNFFSHYCDNDTYPYYCIDSLYKYCIPYKGNEHLVGTSNSFN